MSASGFAQWLDGIDTGVRAPRPFEPRLIRLRRAARRLAPMRDRCSKPPRHSRRLHRESAVTENVLQHLPPQLRPRRSRELALDVVTRADPQRGELSVPKH